METSWLFLFPKELRIAIWTYALTDSSRNTLRIYRQAPASSTSAKRFSNSLRRGSCTERPQIQTRFDKPQTSSTNVSLLRTSRIIYNEGIPVLYHSVQFHPCDLDGIFSLFLEKISPFAQSHIRYVKLSLTTSFGCHSTFYWALTCARVARLGESLRQVEVEAEWPLSVTDREKDNLLYPLLKIKALKSFGPKCDDEYQELLARAKQKRLEKAPMRRSVTAASTAEWMGRDVLLAEKVEQVQERQRFLELTSVDYTLPSLVPSLVSEYRIAEDLSAIAGIDHFQNDLERWEMVDSMGRTDTHDPRKFSASESDDDTWTEATSITIAKEEADNDLGDEAWEPNDAAIVG